MAIPEQIRKQTEAVQQLYVQLNTEESTGEENPTADGAAVVAGVPDTTPADETSNADVANTPPESEQKTGGDNVSDETIVQKYKTLQGMYNAEVPRLHQQNREMTQRVQQMEQLLASLSAQKETATDPQPAVTQSLVTEHDVAEYGESIDVMRRVTTEEVNPLVQRLAQLEQTLNQMQTNVVPQVQAVAQRQQLNSEQQFWTALTEIVPNFREINSEDAFQAWLLNADPLTGITRQTYLEDAQRALDARRVSNFFHTWLETTGQAVDAQPTGRASNSELEKQVTPGRSRGSGTPAATNKAKTYSPQDIQKFFNDVSSGRYKGREEERGRIERDIFSAQRENRIVANS